MHKARIYNNIFKKRINLTNKNKEMCMAQESLQCNRKNTGLQYRKA